MLTDRGESRRGGRRGFRAVGASLVAAAIVLVLAACQPLPAGSNKVASGATLAAGQVLWSPDLTFRITMQADGNLVERSRSGRVWWTSSTIGNPGAKLVMRADGVLAIQTPGGRIVWSTPTNGVRGATVELGNDANFVVKGTAGQPVWANGISAADSSRRPASERTTSTHQVVLTKIYEGFVAVAPYLNSGGNCTVGYGHLIRPGGCTTADRAARWDADALFAADVAEHERRLKFSLGSVPMSQREFDAVFDYIFNRGSLTATTSPQMYAALTSNPPRYADVVAILRANGDTLMRGLCDRRYVEAALFAGGGYDTTHTTSCT